MDRRYIERLSYLVDEDKLDILAKSSVLVCGCGGVGSFVAEALARSGVGELILVDNDDIAISNLNRQLMTTKENIGRSKVEELKKRLEMISDTKVSTIKTFIDESFDMPKCDIVADCIDTLTSKFILNKKAHAIQIPCISSMGSAKRLEPKDIKYTTLDKTKNDPLAKAFRGLVKKEGYKHKIEVVYADTPSIQKEITQEGKTSKERHPLGSAIFMVGSVGLYMAYIICKRLWEEKENEIQRHAL